MADELYLLDSASLSLAPGVELRRRSLLLPSVAVEHLLNEPGRYIACELKNGIRFRPLAVALGARYRISEEKARADLLQFVSALDSEQLVSIRQSFSKEFVGLLRDRLPRRRLPVRRYPASLLWILVGGLEAHQPTTLTGVLLALLAPPLAFWPLIRQGHVPSRTMLLSVALLTLAYVVALEASVIFHEMVHYLTATLLGVRTTYVSVRSHVVAVTHVTADPLKSKLVSASGPAVTAAVLVAIPALILVLPVASNNQRVEAWVLCLVIAGLHLFGLTPLAADGRQIWRPAKEMERANAG